jgi:hypothetical protein
MSSKTLIGSAVFAATFAVGIAACAGTMEDSAPKIVGENAELVAKKQQWLQDYDAHCDVCFKAFGLCEKGADEDQDTLDACQTALDSCVAGGLVKDDDEDEGDDQGEEEEEEDADAGVGDEEEEEDGDRDLDEAIDEANGEEEEEDADAGVGDEEEEEDAEEEEEDDDRDLDEAIDEANGEEDGDRDGEPGDQVKAELIEDIRLCLDQAGNCLDSDDADAGQCIEALEACVQQALDGAFENVCEGQRRQCEERDASDEEIESVEDLCEGGLGGLVD